MFTKKAILRRFELTRIRAFIAAVVVLSMGTVLLPAHGQATQSTGSTSAQKPTQQAPAEAGGPQGDIGPIVIPKKKEAPPEPPPRPPKNPEGMGTYSITKNVNLVNLDVTVLTKNGQFVPGLTQNNFKVLEDGVPQTITNFSQTSQAPITAVLLVEFAANSYYFMSDALNASYTFANMLKPQDWIAVVSYDMKPHMLTDFTQDKRAVYDALGQLRIPGFSETNMFDALYDTLDRLEGVQGRKYIILISTGVDTFSKLTFDQIQKKIKATQNVTIFTISTGEWIRIMADARGAMGPVTNLTFLQADNEMNTFARETGGRWYKPRFEGELPEIFSDIAASIRNQYILAYHPTNQKLDGTFRKLKIELQAPEGGKLTVKDQKGKVVPVQVIAREGYTAKHEVE
jgi:VWFA-related protein